MSCQFQCDILLHLPEPNHQQLENRKSKIDWTDSSKINRWKSIPTIYEAKWHRLFTVTIPRSESRFIFELKQLLLWIICLPLSHLTSPSLMESANGGTITVFASPKGNERISCYSYELNNCGSNSPRIGEVLNPRLNMVTGYHWHLASLPCWLDT